ERVRAFGALRGRLRDLAARRDELAAHAAEGAARAAERRELHAALRAMRPRPGELAELERERDLLVHRVEVRHGLEGAHDRRLEGTEAALYLVRGAIRELGAHVSR